MPPDETPEKRENEEKDLLQDDGGSKKPPARRMTFHLFGADQSGADVVVGSGSNTTEKDLSSRKNTGSGDASSQRSRKLISIEELKQLAESSGTESRFAQDLLTNVEQWRQMPEGQDKDAYAKKQQTAALGMLGRAIEDLEPKEQPQQTGAATQEAVVGEAETALAVVPEAAGAGAAPLNANQHAPQSVNRNIVETKAVYLETADLRALREEDLALGKKGGPAEHFLALLDNFRKILRPGSEQDAAVRRVKRMAFALLSGRLQELQAKKGTAGDTAHAQRYAVGSDEDKQFILELKQKVRGETAQHKVPAQFYERRQTVQEWARELAAHIDKLHELNKSVDVTAHQSQPVGLNAALSRGVSKKKAINQTETEIRKALAMMPEKEIKDLQALDEYKQLVSDLLYSANITSATRQAAQLFLTPGWQKSPESVRQLAAIAIKDNSFELLKSTCRYCTSDVRQGFRQTAEAAEAQKVFSMYGKHLNEVLQYGQESLTTQLGTAEGFAYGWFGLANKEEIRKFVDKASSEDRHRYLLGEKLSERSNLDAEEKQAVSFYKEVDSALRAATNPIINSKQYDLLRNKLVGGEDIYAALRELHKDEYFGLVRSNDMKGMRRAVELLSLKDWTSLRENAGRFADLDERLRKFLNPQEHHEIMGMLRAKVGEKGKDDLTFEESQKRGRVPIEISLLGSDPEKWNIVWTAQNTNQFEKLQMILQMSQLEVNSYLKDKGTPKYLDTLIEAQLEGECKLVAERTLKLALQTGKLETDEISNALIAKLSGAPVSEQLKKFELILSRPGVMSRLKSPQDAEQKALRAALDLMVKEFVEAMKRLDLNVGRANAMSPVDYSRKIFDSATIPIDLRLLLSDNCTLSLGELMKLSSDERRVLTADSQSGGNAFLQKRLFATNEQLQFAQHLFSSGKKEPSEVDRMRAAIIGLSEDKGRLIVRLSSMRPSELSKTIKAYHDEYDASLPYDLFVSAIGRHRTQVQEIFAQELSNTKLPAGALNACAALREFCKTQRVLLTDLPDDEQELLEELAFNYALCREMNILSSKSGFSNLTAVVPLRESISFLANALAGQANPAATAGKSPRPSAPPKNVHLTLVKAIMSSDFDHSLFVDIPEKRPATFSLQALSECVSCNLICLKIMEHALEQFDEVRAKRFLQMIDVLQKRIANIPARLSFWNEFQLLFVDIHTNAESPISSPDRLWLAEQVLCECAFPNNVKAGIGNLTNTMAIACNLFCDNKPATFVWLMTKLAIDDRFETTDGTVIKPSDYGAFCDDLDVMELRNRTCSSDYSDLVGTTDRPLRNLAGKIAQTVLANIYWKRNATSIAVVEENGILRLARDDEQFPATQFNSGEVCFLSTESGHELHVLIGGEKKIVHEYLNERTPVLVPSRSPRIDPDFLPDIYNQVVLNQRTESQLLNIVDNSEATRAF